MSLRFYFDEDAAEQLLVDALRSRGFDVLVPQQIGLPGADDLVQLRWCAEHGYVLISHNISDFYLHHRTLLSSGGNHAGIVLVRQQTLSIGERLRRLIRLAGTHSADEMQNRVEFLSHWEK